MVSQGTGTSYGAELFIQWTHKRQEASLSYNWTKTLYQFADRNGGKAFAPRFDRRHALSLLYQCRFAKRLELNAAWTFATGNPFPVPLSQVYLQGHEEVRPLLTSQFQELDAFRSPLYHRLDANLKIKAKERARKWNWTYYWEIGGSNLYNRFNPSYYSLSQRFVENSTRRARLQEHGIFSLTPSISFNFEF